MSIILCITPVAVNESIVLAVYMSRIKQATYMVFYYLDIYVLHCCTLVKF